MSLEALKEKLVDLQAKAQAIMDKAEAANRDLEEDEHVAIEQIWDDFKAVEGQIRAQEKIAAMSAAVTSPAPRRSEPLEPGTREPQARKRQPDGLRSTTLRTPEDRERWGFSNLGEFAASVRSFQLGQGQDPRLIANAALSTYGSEGVGADGGFAVPPTFRAEITQLVFGEDSLIGRTDFTPSLSPLMTVPTDEDTAWGTSGGVRVYRRGEAAAMTQSKPSLKDFTTRMDPLYALVPVTDELLRDAPMLARWLTRKAAEKIDFKINDELINGTGSGGQMLGIMKAPCLVTVSKEGSQAADTIVANNLLKMYSRMPDRVRRRAVWLINQDIEPQLLAVNVEFKSSAGAGIAAGVAGLVGEGGLRFDPTNGTLMGKPIIATEACSTIGDLGDIILAYLPGYFAMYEAGGLREDMSMHLWFDQGMTAFRWAFRIGGQPWLSAPIARKNGSNTLSHFVTLEAR